MDKILKCHKRGQLVDPTNSCARFELKFGVWPNQNPTIDRHLYPVDGPIPCEGSPKDVEELPSLVDHNRRVDTSIEGKW